MRTSALALLSLTALVGTAANATEPAQLTLYRSDDAALFSATDGGHVQAGYAVIHEPRSLVLKAGLQDTSLGGLPLYLDPEAIALGFDGDVAHIVSQRLQLGQSATAVLGNLLGQHVDVLGASGNSLASGTLVSAGDPLLIRQGDATVVLHDYAAVRASGHVDDGARLHLRVNATRAGTAQAQLSYVTGGLGWRASYVGTLLPGGRCQLQLQSRASVANRSGSNWHDAALTLIAGEPQFGKPSAPRPMMAMALRSKTASAPMPQQSELGDYRSYRLPSPVDLPDGSVSLLPLYAPRTIDCERTELYENGSSYQPPRPMIDPNFNPGSNDTLASTLAFKAFDSFPAGYLRILMKDAHSVSQFIGEGRIEDTPKHGEVTLSLGNAFDLRGTRERTQFKVDKAGRTLDEAFRITLTNAGSSDRTVTVREHPNRWQQWTLASSSIKPASQGSDTLTFKVNVPASGKATLDYAVHYSWTADEQPQ